MAVTTITSANFQSEVTGCDKPVLIDFWAPWCGPCHALSPVIDEIATERADIKVGKVNVDEESLLARQYGVMSIPMIALFHGGQIAGTVVGAMPKEELLAKLGLS